MSNTPDEVREFLLEFLAEELDRPAPSIEDDNELVADLGFDSLSFALGIAEVKQRFSVTLSKEDVFECKTFGDLVWLVKSRRIDLQEPGGVLPLGQGA
jgi:acyl carrier protein